MAKSVRDAASAVGVADFVLATNGSPKEVEELRAKHPELLDDAVRVPHGNLPVDHRVY